MKKHQFKFEVSFNLNTTKGESLDSTSIRAFRNQLYNWMQEWNGNHGNFYAYGSDYGDRDIHPTNIKVKQIK